MLNIDDAILHEIDCAKKNRQLADNFKEDVNKQMCIENAEEHEQIAMMLVELKALQQENKCKDCAGCTAYNCDCSNIKIQAIDDFIEALKQEYAPLDDEMQAQYQGVYQSVVKRFEKVGERLKTRYISEEETKITEKTEQETSIL